MQTEAVSELVMPVTLSIAIYDGDLKVSSEETLTFDSATILLPIGSNRSDCHCLALI